MKFGFLRYKGTSAREYKDRVREVEIVDPLRVRFHEGALARFYDLLWHTGHRCRLDRPEKYLEQVGDDGFKQHPIGAGL